jgi:hypothetical protein
MRESIESRSKIVRTAIGPQVSQAPPRIILRSPFAGPRGFVLAFGASSPLQSAVHSSTLPAMSSAPNGLAPSGKLPTGAVVSHPSLSSYIGPNGCFAHSWPQAFSRLARGESGRGIARALGIAPRTVKKILAREEIRRTEGESALDRALPARRTPRASKLDVFDDRVSAWLEQYPDLTATRLLEKLAGEGFTGSYTIVREHLNAWRATHASPAEQEARGTMGLRVSGGGLRPGGTRGKEHSSRLVVDRRRARLRSNRARVLA